ncbi:transglutaminase family protein [Catellatospora tritici]|uniref:transglutaminase family protein n=1 Tax=Catellatospora tritici TaxID=2851566 RepID=UPI0020C547D4|nr:transglutaminase family protein [Catellatospora tritici]
MTMASPGWRLQIRHRTGFQYGGLVASSYNEARMTPSSEPRQTVLDSRVTVWPTARTYRYQDYWDTTVTSFDVQVPHEVLEVVADATVETSGPAAIRVDGPRWPDLTEPKVVDRWQELLLPTPRTALDEELTELAAGLRAEHASPDEAAQAVCELVGREVAYVPGSTGVQTDAVHVWRQKQGVCQDISHLSISLLRAMGVPARYVSGYLHPTPNAPLGQPVVGQSHAWVEWWTGEWHAFDPTNRVPVGERHVVVGRGRDYGDVPPLKGVYAGPSNTGQTVEVMLTRVR